MARCTTCRTTHLKEPESLASGVCVTCREPEAYCRVCKDPLGPPESIAIRMCTTCRDSLERIELPPPRRKPAPCRGCNNMRFVRFAAGKLLAPPADIGDVARSDKAQWILLDTFVGALESYTCTECGLVEWYGDPRVITLGAQFASELVDYTAKRR
jgi:hypothetical protein